MSDRQARLTEIFLDAFSGASGSMLMVDDPALARRFPDADTWTRYAMGGAQAQPWPTGGPYDTCVLRLPRDRRALEMALHAIFTVLKPGGTLWVYGANDEGIKSTPKRLNGLFEAVATVSYKRHCRVLRARRVESAEVRATLDAWREDATLEIDGRALPWVRLPGVFARGKLDDATARLIEHLPAIAPESRVLDLACGGGVIARAVQERFPQAVVCMCDADAVALEAARHNAPGADAHLGDGFAALDVSQTFDVIVSNPPIHVGVDRSYAFVREMIARAPERLREGGVLRFVTQRQAPVKPWLEASLGAVELVWEGRRDRVWSAAKV